MVTLAVRCLEFQPTIQDICRNGMFRCFPFSELSVKIFKTLSNHSIKDKYFLIRTNKNKLNGGSSMQTTDPLPDTSKTQLMNEISTLFNVFLKHKERVAISLTLQKLTLSDPTRTKQTMKTLYKELVSRNRFSRKMS